MGALIRLLGCLGLLLVGFGAMLSMLVLTPLLALWAILTGRPAPRPVRRRGGAAPAPENSDFPASADTIDVDAVVIEEEKTHIEEKSNE